MQASDREPVTSTAICAEDIRLMFGGIGKSTKDMLLGGDMRALFLSTVSGINAACSRAELAPPPRLVFNAFRLTPIDRVRVVLVGQDPYIGAGQAQGLSFSLPPAMTITPSLRKIFACLQHNGLISDVRGINGDLRSWAEQGVLLLNMALTTQLGKSGAHTKIWAAYSDALFRALSAATQPIAFMLFGKDAQSLATQIDGSRHLILTWCHPSPMADANKKADDPRNFIYCDAFTRANAWLGDRAINWRSIEPVRTDVNARADVDASADDDAKVCMSASASASASASTVASPTVTIFTDGGATRNGKPGCCASWACVAIGDGVDEMRSGLVESRPDLPPPSNNRGELTAIGAALSIIAERGIRRALIVSDSELCIKTLTQWAGKWIAKPAVAEKRKNMDLVVPTYRALCDLKAGGAIVDFLHVNSHKTEPPDKASRAWFLWHGNDRVDRECARLLT